jgi:hypothetical protein
LLNAVAETAGRGFTAIEIFPVAVQPFASVPVTVYVVVAEGESVTEVPLNDPGIHVYVAAPLPVNVVEAPVQIVVLDAVAETIGDVYTVIEIVPVPVQPFASVPVMV